MKFYRLVISTLIVCLLHASSFASQYTPDILEAVLKKVIDTTQEGAQPVIIFDLDDTLINTQDRSLRVLKDFISEKTTQKKFPKEVDKLKNIHLSDIHYRLEDTLKERGIRNKTFIKEAKKFWQLRFYSSDYCQSDEPLPGAVPYVQSLYENGAAIVYLTGRDMPRMELGTKKNLQLYEFPLDTEGVTLIMKPTWKMGNLAFKKRAFDDIAQLGTVVAAFENEPENINALQDRFSEGIMVFIDSAHSPKPDVPNPGIFWIKDYQ